MEYRHRLVPIVKRNLVDNIEQVRFGAVAALFRKCVRISEYDGSESYFVTYADIVLETLRKFEAGSERSDEEKYRCLAQLASKIPATRMKDRTMFGNLVWSEFEDPVMIEHAKQLNRGLQEPVPHWGDFEAAIEEAGPVLASEPVPVVSKVEDTDSWTVVGKNKKKNKKTKRRAPKHVGQASASHPLVGLR